MKLKPTKEILKILLYNMFLEDFKNADVCASDMIAWIHKNDKEMQRYFEAWLIENNYATPTPENKE